MKNDRTKMIRDPRVLYTVWDCRHGDALVCVDATAREAAKAMRLTLGSFYSAVARAINGENHRWQVEKIPYDSEENPTAENAIRLCDVLDGVEVKVDA